MMTEANQEEVAAPEASEGDVQEAEVVTLKKEEYAKLNETIGSLKRDLKDLKKAATVETPSKNEKLEESALLQKLERMSLRQAGIDNPDDIELARATAKKWGVDVDEVLADDDFKLKLERQQTKRSNELATSNIRGGQGQSQAKNTSEYWLAKGTPPTPEDVPNRKVRATIVRAFMKNAGTSGKQFYND